MNDSKQKLKVVAQLEQSNSFPKQDIYFELLRYLVEEEKEGRNVKSSTIAIDLFPSDHKNGISRDSYVRSKMLSLRKDLKQFYLSEGASHTPQLSIPKGESDQYNRSKFDKGIHHGHFTDEWSSEDDKS